MYAIVETGGKQYRVAPGQRLAVELLEAEPGSTVALDRVLLVSDGGQVQVGTPTVPGARVLAEVVEHGKGDKIVVFRYRNKVRYRRRTGHRQRFTRLLIRDIEGVGNSGS